jgi:hypothetical protein
VRIADEDLDHGLPVGGILRGRERLAAHLGTLGLWPGADHWFPGSGALAPAAVAIAALLHLAALQRPVAPVERARWIYPTLGVAALGLAALARSLTSVGDGALLAWALGVAAHVLGLVVGHTDASAAQAGPFARRTLAAAVGSGFAEAGPDRMAILTDRCIDGKDVDVANVRTQLDAASRKVDAWGDAAEGPAFDELSRAVQWFQAQLDAARELGRV